MLGIRYGDEGRGTSRRVEAAKERAAVLGDDNVDLFACKCRAMRADSRDDPGHTAVACRHHEDGQTVIHTTCRTGEIAQASKSAAPSIRTVLAIGVSGEIDLQH